MPTESGTGFRQSSPCLTVVSPPDRPCHVAVRRLGPGFGVHGILNQGGRRVALRLSVRRRLHPTDTSVMAFNPVSHIMGNLIGIAIERNMH